MTVRDLSRRGVLMLGAAGVAVAAAGCNRFGGSGGDAPPSDSGDGGGSGGASGTVNMAWWGDASRAELTEAGLDLFREASGITVTTEFQSGSAYDDRMAVRFAGGNPPDLFAARRERLRDFGDRGSLLELPVGDGIDVSGVPESVLNSGKVGDAQYGIPFGVASVAWVIDAALYEEYGVAVPDMASWSWDDFTEAAAAVTDASDRAVFGADYPLDDFLTMGVWLRQRGQDIWNPDGTPGFDEDAITEWFQMWVDLRDAGAVPNGGDVEDLGAAAEQSAIGRGLVASSSMPSNSYGVFNPAVGGTLQMGFFPGESQAERRGHQIIPGGHWSISATTDAEEAAAQLLDFLVNDVDANVTIGVTRGAPPDAEVAAAVGETLNDDDARSVAYLGELGEFELVAPVPDPVGTSELSAALGTASERLVFGQSTPQEAAAEVMAVFA
ncbi:ABC transporter substrate-binding protein [Pseudactinotalea sp.]|uniref:ABC transporter substrate-binding protein n=1 Tax=Pseudactinotalea sp. TaxID=1926260 RepID=UPI003B3A7AF2